jgi:osmotically inducible protein OsmC
VSADARTRTEADVIERSANVVWDGDLRSGQGRLTTKTSEVLVSMPVTFASRVEDARGRTSPEELLAAAHAACYAMALAEALAEAGTPPEQLEVEATCGLERSDAGLRIASMRLAIAARYLGDEATLQGAVEAAEQRCPVSNALRGNVDVSVDARRLTDGPAPSERPTDPTRPVEV